MSESYFGLRKQTKTELINPLISVITVSYNSVRTIGGTIESILAQSYSNIEYIIIDGGSTDGTINVINSFGKKISKFVAEHDHGIYDALNKGIRHATGDIIGILNSDDFFYNNTVVEKVAREFMEHDPDAVYGDIRFVNEKFETVRYYSSKHFHPGKFKYGFMPAHPSFYVKRELFEKFGYYKADYKIAADYELLIRFLFVNRIKTRYLEMPIVSMRRGGVSNKSLRSNIILNTEILRACRENGIKTNYMNIYSKYFRKVFELRMK